MVILPFNLIATLLCLDLIIGSFFVAGLRFDVVLNGKTKFIGDWAKDAPSIAYPLAEKNVFVLGQPLPKHNFLKMVKIQVTGLTTFDWLDAKNRRNWPETCS